MGTTTIRPTLADNGDHDEVPRKSLCPGLQSHWSSGGRDRDAEHPLAVGAEEVGAVRRAAEGDVAVRADEDERRDAVERVGRVRPQVEVRQDRRITGLGAWDERAGEDEADSEDAAGFDVGDNEPNAGDLPPPGSAVTAGQQPAA